MKMTELRVPTPYVPTCEYCNRQFEDEDSCIRHEYWCSKNPDVEECNYCRGTGREFPVFVKENRQNLFCLDPFTCPKCHGRGVTRRMT